MVVSASLSFLRDETIFDVHDTNLRQLMLNPPNQKTINGTENVSCGQPYPTMNGLRADESTPGYSNPSYKKYIEVFASGYIEFGRAISKSNQYGLRFFGMDTLFLVNFLAFVQHVYQNYVPLIAVVANFSIFNAKEMWLVASNDSERDSTVKWQAQHLELGNFYMENFADERKLVAKNICDRLWQCFHREKCDWFDDAGTFLIPK